MLKHPIRTFSCIIIALFTSPIFAEDMVNITVKTAEKTAVGIGYTVDGKKLGGIGKQYSGKGPQHKKYIFGFRQHSIRGADILCGEHTISKNSTVTLVTEGDKCRCIID